LADELRMRLPNLTIRVTGVPASAVTVSVDGAAVPTEALAVPRPLNPGVHDVVAKSAEGPATETRVELKEGEAREVQLKIAVAPSPPPPSGADVGSHPVPAAGDSSESDAFKTSGSAHASPLVYVGFGVAGAGIAAGAVTGLMAMSKGSSVSDACNSSLMCPHSVHDDLSSGRTLGDVSTISFAVAGAGAIVGVVGIFLSGHQEQAATKGASLMPWITPGGAGLSGSF
jgi:hypothetical protein